MTKVSEELLAKVLAGLMHYGGKQSPRSLAEKLGEKRTHVAKALTELIRMGLVHDIRFGYLSAAPDAHAQDVVGPEREAIKKAAAGAAPKTASVRRL